MLGLEKILGSDFFLKIIYHINFHIDYEVKCPDVTDLLCLLYRVYVITHLTSVICATKCLYCSYLGINLKDLKENLHLRMATGTHYAILFSLHYYGLISSNLGLYLKKVSFWNFHTIFSPLYLLKI